jgi:hypothetical protein
VRGLWYFFGIVIAAGIFSGIAGLGLGYVGGVLWEQIHRHRRHERLKAKAIAESHLGSSMIVEPRVPVELPKLKLVSVDSPGLPDLSGRSITAVKFLSNAIAVELGVMRMELRGNPLIVCGSQRSRFPDAGSRDALCSLIGDRVDSVRAPSPERVEIHFMSGCELIIPRSAVAVA